MSHTSYFKLLRVYSDIWARRHCRVIISGEEHIASNAGENRIYIVSHPTTYDLPLLVHMAKNSFYIVVYADPFAHPIVRWVFQGAGFLKLTDTNGEAIIRESSRLIQAKHPLIFSLKGYGVDFGEDVKPRTGGIRIAHSARAAIYPVHMMIEEGKMIFKYYRDRKGGEYPYTVFHDTLYFTTFLAPLRYEEYAKKDMAYEDFREVAHDIDARFRETQSQLQQGLKEKAEYYRRLKRRGGADHRVEF
jgi:1-acyl-sn-glycerol-3-phosphate acyltransferase